MMLFPRSRPRFVSLALYARWLLARSNPKEEWRTEESTLADWQLELRIQGARDGDV
jgi:hypothetical protein